MPSRPNMRTDDAAYLSVCNQWLCDYYIEVRAALKFVSFSNDENVLVNRSNLTELLSALKREIGSHHPATFYIDLIKSELNNQ